MHSDFGRRRTWQIMADIISVVIIAGSVWVGITVYRLINELATYGRQMEDAGAKFRHTMTDLGDDLGGIPLIGPGIRTPFDGASAAGGALEQAGQSQQEVMHQLALALGIGIAVLPILLIVVVWLLTRYRFARRAGRARALVDAQAGIDLLALRALTTQKLTTIAKIDENAVAAWRRGDDAVMRQLAALELKSSGIRLPA